MKFKKKISIRYLNNKPTKFFKKKKKTPTRIYWLLSITRKWLQCPPVCIKAWDITATSNCRTVSSWSINNHELYLPSAMAFLLSFSPNPPLNPKLSSLNTPLSSTLHTKRQFILHTTSFCVILLAQQNPIPQSLAQASTPSKPALNLANTKSWFQFYGDGFAIRVPPEFEDIMEPEVLLFIYNCLFFAIWSQWKWEINDGIVNLSGFGFFHCSLPESSPNYVISFDAF